MRCIIRNCSLYGKFNNKFGQTLYPIELAVKGKFQMVIFQLYPFALRSLFNMDAQSLNDDCFDLTALEGTTATKLNSKTSGSDYIAILTKYLLSKIERTTKKDDKIKTSIQLILDGNGTISMKDIREKLNLTERTFQRLFKSETGISPKRFSKIVQFQASLEQLTKEEYLKLTEIAYQNGFADQSHFIRMFKIYTGNTPSSFVK